MQLVDGDDRLMKERIRDLIQVMNERQGRCSVRGGLEQIRGEASSIYLKWESVSVRQGCE